MFAIIPIPVFLEDRATHEAACPALRKRIEDALSQLREDIHPARRFPLTRWFPEPELEDRRIYHRPVEVHDFVSGRKRTFTLFFEVVFQHPDDEGFMGFHECYPLMIRDAQDGEAPEAIALEIKKRLP